jgi:hypothetical protein
MKILFAVSAALGSFDMIPAIGSSDFRLVPVSMLPFGLSSLYFFVVKGCYGCRTIILLRCTSK